MLRIIACNQLRWENYQKGPWEEAVDDRQPAQGVETLNCWQSFQDTSDVEEPEVMLEW